MPILIDCPRCKQSLSAAGAMAGGYATCPRCNGLFQVPPGAPNTPVRPGMVLPPSALPASPPSNVGAPPASGPAVAAPPVTTPAPPRKSPRKPLPTAPPLLPPGYPTDSPVAAPPVSSASTRGPLPPPGPATPFTAGPAIAGPTAGPPSPTPPQIGPSAQAMTMLKPDGVQLPATAPKQGGKVARFITAEAAQSKLKPAEDGKLPELSLHDVGDGARKEKAGGSNPLVVLGVIGLSLIMSLALLLSDFEPRDTSSAEAKSHARAMIEEKFFSGLDRAPNEPYQIYLRNAQRAYSRRDFKTERNLYRKVLELLRNERPTGACVTGGPAGDKELEEYLCTLLKD